MAGKSTTGSTRATQRRATLDRERRPYEGPVEWLFPRLEETYTRLGPKDEVEPALQRPRRSAARSAAAGAQSTADEALGIADEALRLNTDSFGC
jgi:hypothetical protein